MSAREDIAALASWLSPAHRRGETGMVRSILELSWPQILQSLATTLVGLLDTRIAGGLGVTTISAIVMSNITMELLMAAALGLLGGVRYQIVFLYGRGAADDAPSFGVAGVCLGLATGAIAGLLFYAAIPFLGHVGMSSEMVAVAREYAEARVWGAPAAFGLIALCKFRQGCGDVRSSAVAYVTLSVLNVGLSAILVYGVAGAARLGARGMGIACAAAEIISMIGMLAFVLWRERAARRGAARMRVRDAVRAIVDYGTPGAVTKCMEMFSSVALIALVTSLGATAAASHQVVSVVLGPANSLAWRLAEAAAVLTGMAIAQKDAARLRLPTRLALLLMTVVLLGWTGACAIFARQIGAEMLDDSAAESLVQGLLVVAVAGQIPIAVRYAFGTALQGAGDVRHVALVASASPWVGLAVGYVLGHLLGGGVTGVHVALVIETTLAGAALAWRWWRGPLLRDSALQAR